MQILFLRSKSSTDMTLLLVYIEDLPHFHCQGWIDHSETFYTVFVHRTLAYPKFFRRLPHRCPGLNYVTCYFHCPLFNIIFQRKIPRRHCFYSVCGGFL